MRPPYHAPTGDSPWLRERERERCIRYKAIKDAHKRKSKSKCESERERARESERERERERERAVLGNKIGWGGYLRKFLLLLWHLLCLL